MKKKLEEPSFDDVFLTPEEERALAQVQAAQGGLANQTRPPAQGPAVVPFENSELAFSNTSLAEEGLSEFGASMYETEDAQELRRSNDPDFHDSIFLGTVKQPERRGAKPRSAAWKITASVLVLGGIYVLWLALGPQNSAPIREERTVHAPVSTAVPVAAPVISTAPAPVPAPAVSAAVPLAPAPAPVTALAPAAATPALVDESAQVRDLVERWRQSWAAGDVTGYLGFYSPQFVPANGLTRAHWLVARRKALTRPAGIDIKITDMRLQRLSEDQFKVEFLQDYASGNYREVAQPKTLVVVRTSTGWQIAAEWQGAPKGVAAHS